MLYSFQMDVNNTLISTGMTAGIYLVYKMIKRYTLRSECHRENNSIEIAIVDLGEEKKEQEEKKEIEIEK